MNNEIDHLTNNFGLLFRGFLSAYGTDEGGCKWSHVTRTTIERHISGEEMIGIYPMVYDPKSTTQMGAEHGWKEDADNNRYYPDMQPDLWHCKWGAIDIDEGDDSLVLARNVSVVLSALNIPSWVELSRSKGCHVWIFNQEWVRASVMRRAMKSALQLLEIPYDAVYPKQDSLMGPPGNYMRIPYGGKRPEGRQEVFDSEGKRLTLEQFVEQAHNNRASLEAIEHAATLYKEPQPKVPDLPPKRDYNKEPLMNPDGSRLRGLSSQMFDNGPVPYYKEQGAGRGRHGFLNRFARSMFESGYNHADVISWTKDLDSRLGQWWDDGPKFQGRHDCERQIERLVQDAKQRATK